MINISKFEDSTSSIAAAERADMMEALLRGELSREDYCTFLEIYKEKDYNEKRK